jgi:hypothetical protein
LPPRKEGAPGCKWTTRLPASTRPIDAGTERSPYGLPSRLRVAAYAQPCDPSSAHAEQDCRRADRVRIRALAVEDHAHRPLLHVGGKRRGFLMVAPFSDEGTSSRSGAPRSSEGKGRLPASPGDSRVRR